AWRWLTQAVDERLESGSADAEAIAMLCGRVIEVPTRWPASMRTAAEDEVVSRYLETGLSMAGDVKTEAKVRLLLGKAFWPFAFPPFPDEADDIARAAGNEARALARDIGRPDLESAALDALGAIEFNRGRHGRMEQMMATRLDLATKLIDPWEVGDTYQMAADNALAVG